MSDERFYQLVAYTCPRCRATLEWRHRPGAADSMMLLHPIDSDRPCETSGQIFYAPGEYLTPIPKEPV